MISGAEHVQFSRNLVDPVVTGNIPWNTTKSRKGTCGAIRLVADQRELKTTEGLILPINDERRRQAVLIIRVAGRVHSAQCGLLLIEWLKISLIEDHTVVFAQRQRGI